MTIIRVIRGVAFGALLTSPIAAQQGSAAELTVQRIFRTNDFQSVTAAAPTWLFGGIAYAALQQNAQGGVDLVRVDAATGATTTIVTGRQLVGDDGQPINVEDMQFTDDENRVVLYHNSVRVWRRNTRGTYHVLDVRTGKLMPASRTAGLQMFAKPSPDGKRVAFVRDNNLFVNDLETGRETQLTRDGSETIINGTTDWVYEEELGLSDAFKWSPDGKHIAFWRFDQSPVPQFPLVEELQLYPKVVTLRYPKAGEPNSRVQLDVIHLETNTTTVLDDGNGNDQYLARLDWVGTDSVLVQRLPRKQNSVDLLMVSATTGKPRLVMTERDSAYVDVENGDLRLVNGDRQFLWLSDRSGWRQLYLQDRNGKVVRQLSANGMDVLAIVGVDARNGWVYYSAAAPTAIERNVYRARI